MKSPKVSILMNCYNGARFLREAIDSVYAQTYHDWEIVFWDDMSTDESAEIAQSYDQRVRYIKAAEFVPLGPARKLGLEQCTGEFMAYLDVDDLWLPEKLEKQMALFFKKPELALVYSDCYLIGANGERKGTSLKYPSFKSVRDYDVFVSLAMDGCIIPAVSVLARRQILTELGGFNPVYNIVHDHDLWLKVAAKYAIDFVPEPLCCYRSHGQNITSVQASRGITETLEMLASWRSQPELSPERQAAINIGYYSYPYKRMIKFITSRNLIEGGQLLLQTIKREPRSLFMLTVWRELLRRARVGYLSRQVA